MLKSKQAIIRFVRSQLGQFLKFSGPTAAGDKFITLDDEYLDRFDEIVVIGDIHGCSEEFIELLNRVHEESASKNPNKCLKIVAGDLVNKGPNSRKVLKICRDLYPESIIAVRGNHDEIVLTQYEKFKSTNVSLGPENKWIEKLPQRYVSYLRLLPYTISIPSLKCVVVHAGLQPSIDNPARETPTELMITMRNIVVVKDVKTGEPTYKCIKSNKEGVAWATFWPGPEHVYFGHDARRRLQSDHEFATGLDTGCVYGDKLSYVYIKGPRKGEILSVNAKKVYVPVKETPGSEAQS